VRRSFSSAAVSGSASYEPKQGIFWGASASWSERPPTAEELFSNGPHLATNQFEVGDAALREEQTAYFDISLKVRRGPFTFAANAFRSTHKDFVFSNETGEIENGLPVFQFTGVDARFHGGEVEAEIEAINDGRWIARFDTSIDYVRAQDLTNGKPLPRTPPIHYRLGLDVERGVVATRVEFAGSAGKGRVAVGETPTDSYRYLNAQVSIGPWGAQGVRFVLQGRNLTNSRARVHTSFIKDVAPLPGRDLRLSAQASF
jgi:iron complex outermembrane receptor protein